MTTSAGDAAADSLGAAGTQPGETAAGTGHRRGGRRLLRVLTIVLLLAVGLGGAGGGAVLLQRELTRSPTRAEISAALATEISSRWRRLTAGVIFPASVSYLTSASVQGTAHLVGIAPPSTCAQAVDPAAAAALRSGGCVTVLRATYLDPSGTSAATVGVAIMRGPAAAAAAARALSAAHGGGLRAVTFAGSRGAEFGNADRTSFDAQAGTGPYVFLFAAGYALGHPQRPQSLSQVGFDLGAALISRLEQVLTGHGRPCAMRDIRC